MKSTAYDTTNRGNELTRLDGVVMGLWRQRVPDQYNPEGNLWKYPVYNMVNDHMEHTTNLSTIEIGMNQAAAAIRAGRTTQRLWIQCQLKRREIIKGIKAQLAGQVTLTLLQRQATAQAVPPAATPSNGGMIEGGPQGNGPDAPEDQNQGQVPGVIVVVDEATARAKFTQDLANGGTPADGEITAFAEIIANYRDVPNEDKVQVKLEARRDEMTEMINLLKDYNPEEYWGLPRQVDAPPAGFGGGGDGGGGPAARIYKLDSDSEDGDDDDNNGGGDQGRGRIKTPKGKGKQKRNTRSTSGSDRKKKATDRKLRSADAS